MTPPAFTIGLELQTPDGDSARVELCGGPNVLVWLTNSHIENWRERWCTYPKDAQWFDRFGEPLRIIDSV